MVKTAKEWAEMFAKLPPTELVWAYWYSKDEVEIHNPDAPSGFGVKDEDWTSIVNDIGDPPDQLHEYFQEAYGSKLREYLCDHCYEYDYSATDIDGETHCKNCGEETDLTAG